MKKVGRYQFKKAEVPVTPLPERGYLSNLTVNKVAALQELDFLWDYIEENVKEE